MPTPNTFALNEPTILALVARLQDPAQLNAEIAEIASNLPLADEAASLVPIPAAQILPFLPPPSFLTAFPTIGIQDLRSKIEDDTGHSATGRHGLGVAIFCSSPDQRLLAWMIRRYAQAVMRVALSGRVLEADSQGRTGAWGTGSEEILWGPTLQSVAKPTTWMSFCVIAIWGRRGEIQGG